MKDNLKHILRFIPKWKIAIYIILSFFLALAVAALLLPAVWYIEDNSRFAESLLFLLSYGRSLVLLVFYAILMIGFLLLFYLYERKRYLSYYVKKLTEEVQQLALEEGKAVLSGNGEFSRLAEGIQEIFTKSEQAIVEVRKAEQLKNELVTNVAHDLRSPLTSIIGYLNLINEDRYQDEVELRHYIQVITDKTAGLHSLIEDIFEYTYMQNQQALSEKHPIDLEELMNQLAVQSRVQLEGAGMEWRQFLEGDETPIVLGDGGKLIRVFENLIQNAVRYGREGKYLDIILGGTGHNVEIQVANYGPAIPGADLPHIFERFFRVEKSRSHFTGGSGLGLAIAKSIIELHGGTIEAKSRPGRTAFIIRLPRGYNDERQRT
ncbi:HAMP domain-containing histidine kinase [Bacillus infantis]|uniref:sensor histidine kinase n=1 Tax=Bacillus infantis TaxID=324767 RepID=UPI000B9C5FAA|nr:HAMP domain-containing sensor histidine kinase [Bacillus infantis]MCK6206387.1 HAMP domain-containing histidine kinase [Bacillus infantis]OXT18479.1 two-component sensor histidine kinase [Bacillus sp. OG2]